MISKWVDYSNKYGFSYQLNNDDIGVLFNDENTLLKLHNSNKFLELIYHDGEGWTCIENSLSHPPAQAKRQLEIVDFFAKYMNSNLSKVSDNEERKEILSWFKHTPDAILTSVGILTTGFDEPTVETIILNRATKSLTLYFQMIGRGSRKLPNKDSFTVIDLGNNAARFGLWSDPVDWQHIFKSPEFYLESLRNDTEIEMHFKYKMSPEVRAKFANTAVVEFDVDEEHRIAISQNLRSKVVLEKSLDQHASMCVDNAETINEAKNLSKLLYDDIESRIRYYTNCLSKSSKNYREWLVEDYKTKLLLLIGKKYREKIMNED
ncbi:MAG: hypothetical protein DI548_06595 [Flavobacterium johnsoniae]|nr:MAG: hypothetical protein DI548_06595 [Flavobacterium johnsoniae]